MMKSHPTLLLLWKLGQQVSCLHAPCYLLVVVQYLRDFLHVSDFQL